jgi:hypothetical protein
VSAHRIGAAVSDCHGIAIPAQNAEQKVHVILDSLGADKRIDERSADLLDVSFHARRARLTSIRGSAFGVWPRRRLLMTTDSLQ